MRSIQSASHSQFSSPTQCKDDKPHKTNVDSTKSEISNDYKKRIKMLQSTIKNLNFPEINNSSRRQNKPIMILERVKFVSGNCENPLKLELFDKAKSESVFPVISHKKTIHKSLKKFAISPLISAKLNSSPSKPNCCRYSSEFLMQSRESLGIRSSMPLNKKELKSQELSPRTFTESLYRKGSSVISSPLSPRTQKEIIEDDFYYLNISKHPLFTSFFSLLECQFESVQNPFPYCGKIFKTNTKRKQNLKRNQVNIGRREISNQQTVVRIENNDLVKTMEVKALVPNISRIFLHPRNVKYPNNVVVINLGIEGKDSDEFWEQVKNLTEMVQVVLVLVKDFEIVSKFIEINSVKLSGIYLVNDLNEFPKEASKIQDYSQIYNDFSVTDIKSQVLIITNHLLEDIEYIEQFIISKSGYSPKISATRVPIPTTEYPETPITFLLPVISDEFNIKLLLNHLNWSLANKYLNFYEIFEGDKFFSFECSFVLALLHVANYPWKMWVDNYKSTAVIFRD